MPFACSYKLLDESVSKAELTKDCNPDSSRKSDGEVFRIALNMSKSESFIFRPWQVA